MWFVNENTSRGPTIAGGVLHNAKLESIVQSQRTLIQRITLISIVIALVLATTGVGCTQSPGTQVAVTETPSAPRPTPAQLAHDGSPLGRAAAFLWSQQAKDGGWHSGTYGLLVSGQALTPFILQALLDVPERIVQPPTGGVGRAFDYIRGHVNDRGVLGVHDPDLLEYPNLATSAALACLLRVGAAEDGAAIRRMHDHLASEQFTEPKGFDASMLAYGGWGFGGTHPPGRTGHMDLAHTRRVMQSLRAATADDELFERAEVFLRLLQKDPAELRDHPVPPETEVAADNRPEFDGGFYFSPIVLAANKGRYELGEQSSQWRSYATATCDGVLALLAAGVSPDDERVEAATAWLQCHPRWDYPAGIPVSPDEHPEPWGDAVRFYHYAVRAETYRALDWPGNWREDLVDELAPRQRADGSFLNPIFPLMKEDDPLLCTALAVVALGAAEE